MCRQGTISGGTGMPVSLLSRLGVAHPIIQAPMAGGWTTPALVAAVANAGGLGNLAGARLTVAEVRTPDRGDPAAHRSAVRHQLSDSNDPSRGPRGRPGAPGAGRDPAEAGHERTGGPGGAVRHRRRRCDARDRGAGSDRQLRDGIARAVRRAAPRGGRVRHRLRHDRCRGPGGGVRRCRRGRRHRAPKAAVTARPSSPASRRTRRWWAPWRWFLK